MISLMVLSGRAMRRARSVCVITRSSRTSRRTSPGGIAQSGPQACARLVAMIINYLLNQDLRYTGAIEAAGTQAWERVVIRGENQTVRAPQAHSEVPLSIPM